MVLTDGCLKTMIHVYLGPKHRTQRKVISFVNITPKPNLNVPPKGSQSCVCRQASPRT